MNHPGNNAMEPVTFEGFVLWWERATDVSEVLDSLLADPTLGARIDTDRIGAVGFSLGGYTVLELAGARTDQKQFLDFCASPAADAICRPPEMNASSRRPTCAGQLPPATTASMARSGDSYRDPRIKAVFAIAPALGEAFNQPSFTDVHIPVSLMAGTADPTAPVQTNIQRIAGLMPNAKVQHGAGRLALHLPRYLLARHGGSILAQLARIGPGVDRDTVHAQAVERALAFFATLCPRNRFNAAASGHRNRALRLAGRKSVKNAIPLPDASVDAVVCAQSFHWFATREALAEIHRVLKPSGKLGLVWNTRDAGVDWVAQLDQIVNRVEGDTPYREDQVFDAGHAAHVPPRPPHHGAGAEFSWFPLVDRNPQTFTRHLHRGRKGFQEANAPGLSRRGASVEDHRAGVEVILGSRDARSSEQRRRGIRCDCAEIHWATAFSTRHRAPLRGLRVAAKR